MKQCLGRMLWQSRRKTCSAPDTPDRFYDNAPDHWKRFFDNAPDHRDSLTTLPPPVPDEPDAQTLSSIIPTTRPSVFINCGNLKNYTDSLGNVWIPDTGLCNSGANDTLRTRAMRTWTGKRFTRQSVGGMFWSIQSLFRLASTASFLTLWNLFRVVSCRRACLLCVFTRWSDCQTFGCLWKDWRRQYPVCVKQDRRSDWWLFSYQLWKDQTKSQDQCNTDSSSKCRLYRWGVLGDDHVTISFAETTQSLSDQVETIQPIFINCGSSGSKATNYTDTSGHVWIPDDGYFNAGANKYFSAGAIANTQDPFIYQSERYSKTLTYTINLPPVQRVEVILHFKELSNWESVFLTFSFRARK